MRRSAPASSVLTTMIISGLLMLTGCGDAPAVTDFTISNRDGFLAACTRPVEDPRLLSEVCGCVFDRAEDEFDFDRFAQLDAELKADPTGPLPDEVTDLVADCFLAETGLSD